MKAKPISAQIDDETSSLPLNASSPLKSLLIAGEKSFNYLHLNLTISSLHSAILRPNQFTVDSSDDIEGKSSPDFFCFRWMEIEIESTSAKVNF